MSSSFNDEINYEDFCIIIHSSELNKLPSLLKNINIDEKRENLKKIKNKFKIEEIVDYIVKKL